MNHIYNNVLYQLKELVINEKEIFRNKILNNIQKNLEIEVDEYELNNDIFYSDGKDIYRKINNVVNKVGFENNNIFYIFEAK